MSIASPNFAFLAEHDALLVRLPSLAERYVHDDPNTAILKLRQFAECLAQRAAASFGIDADEETPQVQLIRDLEERGALSRELVDIFHHIRRTGNDANHAFAGDVGDAIQVLKLSRELAMWFQRSFGKRKKVKFGPFTRPEPPIDRAAELQDQIAELQADLEKQHQETQDARQQVELAAQSQKAAETQARAAAGDMEAALELAEQTEQLLLSEQKRFEQQLTTLRQQRRAAPANEIQTLLARSQAASDLELDEEETRRLIDTQLRDAGWEADTTKLTFATGVRPQKGKNIAIAEWPTQTGPADYVLFHGLTPLAVVEAKRKRKDAAGAIEQAKRYSKGFKADDNITASGGPWGAYKIPFLFGTNGRPYLRQIQERSGIWFLDARRATNHPYALEAWLTPEGLAKRLEQDIVAADQTLRDSASDYLPLRDYQHAAVRAAEAAIAEGQRAILLAMATGTGKTRTCIGLVYRLIKAQRFQRVLFLVDRTTLGEQATENFKDVRLENAQTFPDIYDVKELKDLRPDSDTRLHIATVQGMVKRLLYPSDTDQPVAVDSYDCIVVDECHRGYSLDREMSDTELDFRSEADYISKYRRVLDHFDAVKIGLTATPALHTTEIFGAPAYQYSYRQAVIDGNLVDHEPPYRITTKLGEEGIHWAVNEEVSVLSATKEQPDLFQTPDEIDIEIEGFNRDVITESFNQVVCRELARQIDPTFPGKTLIFCATDTHADLVVRVLKKEFDAQYGAVDDDTVQKITGQADRPQQKIRQFKNERLPSVAVTVDLLTTGVDVPKIVNLVFLRRVRSRILYEQMLGRATRLCPDLYGPGEDKEFFRIFDAVELYQALEDHTAMTPVVSDPLFTFARLVDELLNVTHPEVRSQIKDQIQAKLQSKHTKIEKTLGEAFEAAAGTGPRELLHELRSMTPVQAAEYFAAHAELASLLDRKLPSSRRVLISHHQDQLLRVERGYGDASRPEDYLESFGQYIAEHMNDIPALLVVTQRPRELTRKELKELKLALDSAGYNELRLRTAWQEMTNQDITASIIGFIRQRALDVPLRPYEERVAGALQRILASRRWTQPQRRWLERIGKQLELETIVDRESLDRGQFQAKGGFQHLNKIFGGQLEEVLGELHEELWKESA